MQVKTRPCYCGTLTFMSRPKQQTRTGGAAPPGTGNSFAKYISIPISEASKNSVEKGINKTFKKPPKHPHSGDN